MRAVFSVVFDVAYERNQNIIDQKTNDDTYLFQELL